MSLTFIASRILHAVGSFRRALPLRQFAHFASTTIVLGPSIGILLNLGLK